VHFETWEDMYAFSVFVGQKITPKTRCIWYPPHIREKNPVKKMYVDEEKVDTA
jgi:hypothetical protein